MSIAGIVVLTRHGDRQGFYQSPTTYSASKTNLTVLGYQEEYQNGQDLRSTYLTGSKTIPGVNPNIAEDAQLLCEADGAGEGEVIIDSAYALLQGLYPPYNDTITLANSTVVSWDRTQLIRVNTIEEDDISLEGWTDCNTWTTRLNDWYNSPSFQAQAKIANPFFQSLSSILGPSRPANLQNAWNLFDYLNVNYIHNSTIANQLSAQQLAEARYWANYHETGSFGDSDLSNIGNIAGFTMLPGIISNIEQVANSTNPVKIAYTAISYKPFISLFNLWGSGQPYVSGIVEYASAVVIEVNTDGTLNFLFRNGTDGDFNPLPVLGSTQNLPMSTFVNKMSPYQLPTLASWCDACGTSDERGCSTLASLNGTGGAGYASIDSTNGHHQVSPVVAGVIGAMVTLAVVMIALIAAFLGKSLFASKKNKRSSNSDHYAMGPQLSQNSSNDGHHTLPGSVQEKRPESDHNV